MELFAELSKVSEQIFQLSEVPFLRPIIQDLHTTADVLTRLNIVELIERVQLTALLPMY